MYSVCKTPTWKGWHALEGLFPWWDVIVIVFICLPIFLHVGSRHVCFAAPLPSDAEVWPHPLPPALSASTCLLPVTFLLHCKFWRSERGWGFFAINFFLFCIHFVTKPDEFPSGLRESLKLSPDHKLWTELSSTCRFWANLSWRWWLELRLVVWRVWSSHSCLAEQSASCKSSLYSWLWLHGNKISFDKFFFFFLPFFKFYFTLLWLQHVDRGVSLEDNERGLGFLTLVLLTPLLPEPHHLLGSSLSLAFDGKSVPRTCLGLLTSLLSFTLCKELFLKRWGLSHGLVSEVFHATEMSNYSTLLPGRNFGNRNVHNWVCAPGSLQGVGFRLLSLLLIPAWTATDIYLRVLFFLLWGTGEQKK